MSGQPITAVDVLQCLTLLHGVGDAKERFVQILLYAGLFQCHDDFAPGRLRAYI